MARPWCRVTLVGAFNKEKAIQGAFSGPCETSREGSLPALVLDDYKARWRGPGVGLPWVVFHNIIVTATCGGGEQRITQLLWTGASLHLHNYNMDQDHASHVVDQHDKLKLCITLSVATRH